MGDLSVWPLGSWGAAGASGAPAAGPDGVMPYAIGCMPGAAMMTGGPPGACRLMRTFSSPSVISISPMPDSCTRSISFFSLRRSMPLHLGADGPRGSLEGELVHHGTQA